jgi:hypothetical protein
MDAHLFQSITVATDTLIFLFVIVYFWKFHRREKELEKKEQKIDTEYHKIVDDALSRERKILEDAIKESEKIIMDTKFISRDSKTHLDQSLSTMVSELQHDALTSAKQYTQSYQTSLQQISHQSLSNFQQASSGLESQLQKQIQQFQASIIPTMQKEIDTYKQSRMKDIDDQVTVVVQKVSQAVLRKSIPVSDHQQLIIDALEKAKQQDVFAEFAAKPETSSQESGTRNQELESSNQEQPPKTYPSPISPTDIPQSVNLPADRLASEQRTENPQTAASSQPTEAQALSDEIRSQSPGIVNANDYGQPQPN